MPFICDIITQERLVYNRHDIESVTVQGIEGQMTILSQHAPLITILDYGEVRVRKEGEEEIFAIGGGILQVADNHMVILADSAERSDEIDIARAEEARRRAKKMMEEGAPADPEALAKLEAALKRADIRVKVAGQRRSQRGPGVDV
ncbi:MAG: ATP synthase F1 subunit epsilon [Anaerolineae bacterium]|nr:ATP synthase F1 subunit epsilon [Anaerolineae bacterium]